MNQARIRTLAAMIEKRYKTNPERFNMRYTNTSILGCLFYLDDYEGEHNFEDAADYLDLDTAQATSLFNPRSELENWNTRPADALKAITANHAAACLRNLAHRGVVNWPMTAHRR